MSIEAAVNRLREAVLGKSPHPNIVPVISEYATLEDMVFDRRGESRWVMYNTKRYFLPLKQEATKYLGFKLTDTAPVHAEIKFYDDDLNEVRELSEGEAFWFRGKPRARTESSLEQDPIIRKNGRLEGVCLLIKQIGSRNFYAFNQNSYIPGTGDFQFKESMKLKASHYHVMVEINDGVFEKRTFWLSISKPNEGEHPIIKLVNPSLLPIKHSST